MPSINLERYLPDGVPGDPLPNLMPMWTRAMYWVHKTPAGKRLLLKRLKVHIKDFLGLYSGDSFIHTVAGIVEEITDLKFNQIEYGSSRLCLIGEAHCFNDVPYKKDNNKFCTTCRQLCNNPAMHSMIGWVPFIKFKREVYDHLKKSHKKIIRNKGIVEMY